MFDRNVPCSTCPFRRVGEHAIRGLGCRRATEIAECLKNDGTFTCHSDVNGKDHCVGAGMILEKTDNPNEVMRISERLGLYDPAQWMIHEEDVFDDFEEFIDAQYSETRP